MICEKSEMFNRCVHLRHPSKIPFFLQQMKKGSFNTDCSTPINQTIPHQKFSVQFSFFILSTYYEIWTSEFLAQTWIFYTNWTI